MRRLLLSVAPVLLSLAMAVGAFVPTVPIATAATVISPGNTSATVGTNVTETATVTDGSGNPVADGTAVTWSITGATSGTAAIVSQDTTTTSGQASLTYSNTTAGTDTVTVTSNSVSASASVVWTPGPPATLTLSPGDTTTTVGNSVTETATVKDQYGNLVADGTTVNFAVTGITTTSGSSTTTNGQASFTYSAILPGTDTLTATAVGGTNPSDTATITWTLPASTPNALVGIGNFGVPYVYGAATTMFGGGPSGSLLWRSSNVSFVLVQPDALVVNGPNATVFGTVTLWSGQTPEIRLDVTSGGNFGGTVRLRMSNGYDSGTVWVMYASVTP